VLNPRIQKWLDQGYFKEALLGDGKFFIPNHTYYDTHDVILIISQLFLWVEKNKKDISNELEKAIIELLNERFRYAIRIIHCFFISKEDNGNSLSFFNFDCENIKNEIKKAINKHAQEIVEDESLRYRIMEINKYWPGIID